MRRLLVNLMIKVGRGIEPFDTAIVELQVKGEIVISCNRDNFVHFNSSLLQRLNHKKVLAKMRARVGGREVLGGCDCLGTYVNFSIKSISFCTN